jgi:hypothetical protein
VEGDEECYNNREIKKTHSLLPGVCVPEGPTGFQSDPAVFGIAPYRGAVNRYAKEVW